MSCSRGEVSITGVQTSGIAEKIQRSPKHRLLVFWSRVIGTLRRRERPVIDTRSRLRSYRLQNGQTLYYYDR